MAGSNKIFLQCPILESDTTWDFNTSTLPSPQECLQKGIVKSFEFVSSQEVQSLTLKLIRVPSSRALKVAPLESFIHVSFSNFRLQLRNAEAVQPAKSKQSAEYIARFLRTGLSLNGVLYSFFGHSNSQLKSRTCFLLAGRKDVVAAKVENFGDFAKINSVAKKAKRIGLLFSSAHAVCDVPLERCLDIDDVERKGFIFTDGCGLISSAFARQLSRDMPIIFRNRRYRPSVYQIRYRGYKGVVTLEPKIESGIWLKLRRSMRKFVSVADMSFAVVDYSRVRLIG